MFGIGVLIAFVPVAIALIISTGSDRIYILVRNVSDGQSSEVLAALRSSTGSIAYTTDSGIELSDILRTSALACSIAKFVVESYHLYLVMQTSQNTGVFDITPESTS